MTRRKITAQSTAAVFKSDSNPKLSPPLLQDPRAFLEEQRVKVPQEATLNVEGDGETFRRLEARFQLPTLGYAVGWSEEAGFYVNTLAGEEPTAQPI